MKILFVCLGNICRSPSAEGMFRKLVTSQGLDEVIQVDSAGTYDYHIGKPPDERAQAAAARRGIDLSGMRGRQVTREDLENFDYVLAMDRENLYDLYAICPSDSIGRIKLFMEFAGNRSEKEVPDPYFGGRGGFDRVLDMIEEAAEGLLADIKTRL